MYRLVIHRQTTKQLQPLSRHLHFDFSLLSLRQLSLHHRQTVTHTLDLILILTPSLTISSFLLCRPQLLQLPRQPLHRTVVNPKPIRLVSHPLQFFVALLQHLYLVSDARFPLLYRRPLLISSLLLRSPQFQVLRRQLFYPGIVDLGFRLYLVRRGDSTTAHRLYLSLHIFYLRIILVTQLRVTGICRLVTQFLQLLNLILQLLQRLLAFLIINIHVKRHLAAMSAMLRSCRSPTHHILSTAPVLVAHLGEVVNHHL